MQQPPIVEQLAREVAAMASFALGAGMPVSVEALDVLAAVSREGDAAGQTPLVAGDLAALTRAHEELAFMVKPATPRSIMLLRERGSRDSRVGFLGQIPLIRHMMLAALFFSAAFIGLSLSSDVNAELGAGDPLRSSGLPLLMNQLFFVAAAGLGASFFALFTANRYLVKGTFDPKYESSYWIRFTLGIIAGIVLAGLIPVEGGDQHVALTKPLLAMLGGFSASLLYRLLTRFVVAMESVVRGSAEEVAQADLDVDRARLREEHTRQRIQVAGELMDVRAAIAHSGAGEDAIERLDRLVAGILPMTERPSAGYGPGGSSALAYPAGPAETADPVDPVDPVDNPPPGDPAALVERSAPTPGYPDTTERKP